MTTRSSRTVTCPACGHESAQVYRCAECGRGLTGATTTSGREDGR